MESLYSIQTELLDLFGQIEANEGEVTDEMYEKLCLTEENLKSKLESYYKALKVWSNEADACKKEKARINDVQNKYKNRVERLKKAMLDAVVNFGDAGKTNYFIELPTVRLFSKTSTSIEVDERRSEILVNAFREYISELVKNDILCTGDDIDIQGFLNVLNANCTALLGDDFIPFNLQDLCTVQLEISDKASIIDLLINYKDLLNELGKSMTVKVVNATTKEEYKKHFDMAKSVHGNTTTIAKQVTNTLLGIN